MHSYKAIQGSVFTFFVLSVGLSAFNAGMVTNDNRLFEESEWARVGAIATFASILIKQLSSRRRA
jgi:hypothetical protein